MVSDVEHLFMCLLAVFISSFHLCIYFWFCWVFVGEPGLLSSRDVWTYCSGFSCRSAQVLGHEDFSNHGPQV